MALWLTIPVPINPPETLQSNAIDLLAKYTADASDAARQSEQDGMLSRAHIRPALTDTAKPVHVLAFKLTPANRF